MSHLKKYENLCFFYKKAHAKACSYYISMNTKLNVTNIAIVSLIGISNNITSIIELENKILPVCYSIVLYFSVVLSALKQFLKYEELAEKHRISGVRYSHLYNLCFLSKESDLGTIIEEYENIYNTAPVLPDYLKQEEHVREDYPNIRDVTIEDIDLATTHQLSKMIIQSYKS